MNKRKFKAGSSILAAALMTSTISSVCIPHVAYANNNRMVSSVNNKGNKSNQSQRSLMDLEWSKATIGWGKIQKNKSIDKHPITLDKNVYSKGIGTHADSEIIYNLNGEYSRFTCVVGIDDETGDYGSVIFSVYGDGELLFDSGIIKGTDNSQNVDIDISGVNELKLMVNGAGDNINHDHADWANPVLFINDGNEEIDRDSDIDSDTENNDIEDSNAESGNTENGNTDNGNIENKDTESSNTDQEKSDNENDESEVSGTEKSENSKFTYHWEADGSLTGYEVSDHVNKAQTVEFLDQKLKVIDETAAEKLSHYYNIILSNDESEWSKEDAYVLLQIMNDIPQKKRSSYDEQNLKPSKWILTDRHIKDDIEIIYTQEGNSVIISKDAFENAAEKVAKVDGIKGSYYSQKLHHALVRYVTKNGTDLNAVEKILNDRYGCTTRIPDYKKLTASTTNEDKYRFQQFKPKELVMLINVFEEMPEGYHAVDGLKYLVRRSDGTPHPLYPQAAAVAWPMKGEDSYIEFMEVAFLPDTSYITKLIAHEKTHFMWENLFSEELKNEWMKIGGWYKNEDDGDGWSTTKTTEFVTAYAHGINPNEDMAESVAHFIFNPNKLKAVSPDKYEFIKNYIMFGNMYISTIRDDLTFEVLNLAPDYDYPGKIKRVDITADGSPNEDKKISVEIELDTKGDLFKGAENAALRIHSEIGTYKDLRLVPVKGTNGSVLRGSTTISKNAKGGLWSTDQIRVSDKVGNQRYEGVDDFGWKLYINNDDEDITPPEYVKNSLEYKLTDEIIEGRKVKKLNVSWEFIEEVGMKKHSPVYAMLVNDSTIQDRLQAFGEVDPKTGRATVDFYLTEYMQSGNYYVSFISMKDEAENDGIQRFSHSPKDEDPKYIEIVSSNPDSTLPSLDLNKITVKAEPLNADKPDGETQVEITYYAKDDKAGLGTVSYRLLDPQGKSRFGYSYHENTYTLFFKGEPTEWKKYTINAILPKGSAPGTWGLQQLTLKDKAGNKNDVNFEEIIHFNVLND